MNESVDLNNDQPTPAMETPAPAVEAAAPVEVPVVETPVLEVVSTSVPEVVAAITASPSPVAAAETTSERGHRKVRIGAVVSNKMQKSILVSIERRIKHPLYKKYFTLTTKLMAHDEKQEARIGDIVKITETRPLSKRKCWRLVEVIERAK